MSLFKKIQDDMYTAMKAGEKDNTNTLRTTLAKLKNKQIDKSCLLYTSPSPRDRQKSRMPSSA